MRFELREMALVYGEQCLLAQQDAPLDIRSYPERIKRDGETEVERTLFCMLNGTGGLSFDLPARLRVISTGTSRFT